mmetsp:Transcript_14784/g.22568  ORF Transcript_14784/g.22568 Transcript_14784/m.22568 type:complete len:392 (-) Transcript_14784:149-1324(-)
MSCYSCIITVLVALVSFVLGASLFVLLFAFQGTGPNKDCAGSFGPVTYLHRGNLNFAQENTFDAVVNGAALQGMNPEIDITALSDGSAVLFHDKSLKRITGVDKLVEDATLEELLSTPISAVIDGYDYGSTNNITEFLPVVKAICAVEDISINFDLKMTEAIDPVVDALVASDCTEGSNIITTAHPNVVHAAREALDDAGREDLRIGAYLALPGSGEYYFLGIKFFLKTRLMHALPRFSGSDILEFHASVYEHEKELIQKWRDDGWCTGVYGIKPEEVGNYDVDVYIVDEGPSFPDLPYGGLGDDNEPEPFEYKNGQDDSLLFYYIFIAVAGVLMLIFLICFVLLIRRCCCKPKDKEDKEGKEEKGEYEDGKSVEIDSVSASDSEASFMDM